LVAFFSFIRKWNLFVNITLYSGHSFRRGVASFALECGVPS
jgi:hypothetical protein